MIRIMKYGLMMSAFFVIFYACNDDDATPKKAPSVTTAALTNITTTNATGGGTITSNGGSTVTASGIVLSRGNEEPTLMDTVYTNTVETGGFTVNITGLEFNRTYYIRAYATNAIGTTYGDVVTLNTTNDDTKVRFVYNGEEVIYGVITSATTGKKWLDRNIGSSAVATSLTDTAGYGALYQWGRGSDGHQLRKSGKTETPSSTDQPGHSNFIFGTGPANFNVYGGGDWRNPLNDNLWQGNDGINNPCPQGWHVPTINEWEAELAGLTDFESGFTQLKLTAAGYRSMITGNVNAGSLGTVGWYMSSSVEPQDPNEGRISGLVLQLSCDANSGYWTKSVIDRSIGQPLRCIIN